MTRIDLTGLEVRPSQVWGGVRLVPLVRAEPVEGLRLHRRIYEGAGGPEGSCDSGGSGGSIDLGGGVTYSATYIPHGFVADWSESGQEAAAYGTRLGEEPPAAIPVRRLARRHRGERRLRFLPLHLALEGYLSLHFGGPSIAWEEWSGQAVRRGLSPRAEAAYTGRQLPGLAEALRVFEIHPGQCGMLLYVSDALAAAFVVPHPDDYRVLHPTLVEDLFGELVHQYALYGAPVADFTVSLESAAVHSLADLRAAAREREREWARAHDGLMARDLLESPYAFDQVHRLGGFRLFRFLPPFERSGREQHIGELIADHRGRTAYLKTFRLSEAQIRRGHLLRRLADCDWHLERTARALGASYEELVARIRRAGFETLLNEHAVARRARELREG
ncbi:hypothetical protein [Streptomyces sp. NPDC048659]|uniref:ARPP-2 domain-containing protein n=1 Tax=Streptomyces sp. NPDC048659 TaxID=3155489 RepID=UPI0034211EBA